MEIKINGDFHDYCARCEYLDLIVNSRTADGNPTYTCSYYCKCQQIWDRLSTIKRETGYPPIYLG